MKKFDLLRVCIIMVLMISLSSIVLASEQITIPSFDVTFNSAAVDSSTREYPLIVYKNITYFPMTYHDSRFLGLTTEWDNATQTLKIDKCASSGEYEAYKTSDKNNSTDYAEISTSNIIINGKWIDNKLEQYPILTYRNITYFPLTWHYAVEEFGWSYEYTDSYGLMIATDEYKDEFENIKKERELDKQRYVYAALLLRQYRSMMKDPSSFKLNSVYVGFDSTIYSNYNFVAVVDVSGKNSYGGVTRSTYTMLLKTDTGSYITDLKGYAERQADGSYGNNKIYWMDVGIKAMKTQLNASKNLTKLDTAFLTSMILGN